VTAAEKINRALANYLATPLPPHHTERERERGQFILSHISSSARSASRIHSSAYSIGFTEEHTLQPRVQSIRVLQKLPQWRRVDLHFPESNSWQTDQLIADLISMISSRSEGWSSLMISACKDCLLFEGVIFMTSDTQTQYLSVTKM